MRVGDRLAEYLGSLMPTLLHVLAHPGLSRERLIKWHEGLPFHVLVCALTERFERLRDDGLVGPVDPAAAARALVASVHSTALLGTMMQGGPPGGRHGHVETLIDVLWKGLAPGAPRKSGK